MAAATEGAKSRTNEKGRAIYYYRASGCKSCPLKARCTRNKENRTITRLAAEEVQEKMAERVAKNPQIMRRRKASSNIASAQSNAR